MKVDYARLKKCIDVTSEDICSGTKNPVRNPKVRLTVLDNLQGEVVAGKFIYRTDAALDAGGSASYPRPMDYLLGALASCQQMWCLRWAALRNKTITGLVIEAESSFTWEGEYLEKVDSGITELKVFYHVEGDELSEQDLYEMADMVARRCPIFATLRKAAVVVERFELNGAVLPGRKHLLEGGSVSLGVNLR